MAIFDRFGKGHYPYTFTIEPEYNGKPLSQNNQIAMSPRYTNSATADSWYWSNSGDYSPAGCYVDLSIVHVGMSNWYTTLSGHGGSSNQLNHPGDINNRVQGAFAFNNVQGQTVGHRMSIWMSIAVGSSPHPGYGTAETYFAVLTDALGDYAGGAFYNAPGGTAQYNNPRVWCPGTEKIRVSGQNYGNGTYRDWVCIANQQTVSGKAIDINPTTMRIVNIGRTADSSLRIYGFKIIFHIMPPGDGEFGNLSL